MNLHVPDDAVRENEETPEMLNKGGGGGGLAGLVILNADKIKKKIIK
jgi:hypothetical protein